MENTNSLQSSGGFSEKITGILNKYPVILQLLRFAAIGVFNTTMDVLLLNFMAAQFGITKGASIGWVNLPGFTLALIQSYYWNRYWAFSGEAVVSLLKNFLRLVAVGVVGILVYGLIVLGAHNFAQPIYFGGIFVVFVLAQLILWYSFGFFKSNLSGEHQPYLSFLIVSLIGFLINSLVLYFTTTHLNLSSNSGDSLNIGKIIATVASLIWNFIGYKIFVFKK